MSVLGLDGKVKVESADHAGSRRSVRQQNPLGKVPVLVLDDGSAMFDSPVILEYLDHLAGGGKIIPKDPKARFDALRLQALADGIMDASILIVYEGRYRPAEKHEQKWLDLQSGKVDRALAALEAAPPGARCAAECRPDHARLRARLPRIPLPGTLRKNCPRLTAWLDSSPRGCRRSRRPSRRRPS